KRRGLLAVASPYFRGEELDFSSVGLLKRALSRSRGRRPSLSVSAAAAAGSGPSDDPPAPVLHSREAHVEHGAKAKLEQVAPLKRLHPLGQSDCCQRAHVIVGPRKATAGKAAGTAARLLERLPGDVSEQVSKRSNWHRTLSHPSGGCRDEGQRISAGARLAGASIHLPTRQHTGDEPEWVDLLRAAYPWLGRIPSPWIVAPGSRRLSGRN